jgi:hypothetical protein
MLVRVAEIPALAGSLAEVVELTGDHAAFPGCCQHIAELALSYASVHRAAREFAITW